jgi:hypothetical protein
MPTHPVFTDILMHSDQELADIMGVSIVSRRTIHEWPLSCVQELVFRDGSRRIYKSQLPPTVEPEFYEQASPGLLPGHQALGKLGNCSAMLIDWIGAPLLSGLSLGDRELADHGKRIIARIGEIGGGLPAYLHIGSEEAWSGAVRDTLDKLDRLIAGRRFRLVHPDTLRQVRIWSRADHVLDAITRNPRVIHGDLKADQVFLLDDGYRIIDWQRPYVAPPEVDLVSLLVDRHADPRPYAAGAAIGIFWFLRLHWAVEAQHGLFPGKRWPLFDQWASEAIMHILENGEMAEPG